MLKICAICSSFQCNPRAKQRFLFQLQIVSVIILYAIITAFPTESAGSYATLIISIVCDTEILFFVCVISKAKGNKCSSKSLHV